MPKFSRYAEGGIGQYWIVDPAVPSIQVYSLSGDAYELIAEGTGDQAVSVIDPLDITIVPNSLSAD